MRATHTFAELEVSVETYAEVHASLKAAGYDHALNGEDGPIDMAGLALVKRERHCFACGFAERDHYGAEHTGCNHFRAPSEPEAGSSEVDAAGMKQLEIDLMARLYLDWRKTVAVEDLWEAFKAGFRESLRLANCAPPRAQPTVLEKWHPLPDHDKS